MPAPNLPSFRELPLPGGFTLPGIALVPGPMIDPIGRSALAKTVIEGRHIAIVLDEAQPPDEQSISIYHEVLEGLTVAVTTAPVAVVDFCEGDFEREARIALQRFGVATPQSVIASSPHSTSHEHTRAIPHRTAEAFRRRPHRPRDRPAHRHRTRTSHPPAQPVARQKEAIVRALHAVLERKLKEPAAV